MEDNKAWKYNNTIGKLDEHGETFEERRDREVLEYFKSIPCITKRNSEGLTILPDDMR